MLRPCIYIVQKLHSSCKGQGDWQSLEDLWNKILLKKKSCLLKGHLDTLYDRNFKWNTNRDKSSLPSSSPPSFPSPPLIRFIYLYNLKYIHFVIHRGKNQESHGSHTFLENELIKFIKWCTLTNLDLKLWWTLVPLWQSKIIVLKFVLV